MNDNIYLELVTNNLIAIFILSVYGAIRWSIYKRKSMLLQELGELIYYFSILKGSLSYKCMLTSIDLY